MHAPLAPMMRRVSLGSRFRKTRFQMIADELVRDITASGRRVWEDRRGSIKLHQAGIKPMSLEKEEG